MKPYPLRPIQLKEVESVPPGSRVGGAVAPMTAVISRSFTGAIHCSKMALVKQIAVGGDAAEAPATGVVVEVGVELGELRRLLHRVARGEVLLHIKLRSEQSFFLSTPERDANGAIHRLVQRCENADGFNGDRRAGAVVGGAGSTLPGVKVAAKHHDFVFLGRAGYLANDVEAHLIVLVGLGFDVECRPSA